MTKKRMLECEVYSHDSWWDPVEFACGLANKSSASLEFGKYSSSSATTHLLKEPNFCGVSSWVSENVTL